MKSTKKGMTIAAVATAFAAPWMLSYAQNIPVPPQSLLEHQIRASQWEQQQEQIKREAEITRLRTELLRAQNELRAISGALQDEDELPGLVAVFAVDGVRTALVGYSGGAQWPVQEGDLLPSGHRVERVQAGSVTVVKGEGRKSKRSVLRPMVVPVTPSTQTAGGNGAATNTGAAQPGMFPMPPAAGISPSGVNPIPVLTN